MYCISQLLDLTHPSLKHYFCHVRQERERIRSWVNKEIHKPAVPRGTPPPIALSLATLTPQGEQKKSPILVRKLAKQKMSEPVLVSPQRMVSQTPPAPLQPPLQPEKIGQAAASVTSSNGELVACVCVCLMEAVLYLQLPACPSSSPSPASAYKTCSYTHTHTHTHITSIRTYAHTHTHMHTHTHTHSYTHIHTLTYTHIHTHTHAHTHFPIIVSDQRRYNRVKRSQINFCSQGLVKVFSGIFETSPHRFRADVAHQKFFCMGVLFWNLTFQSANLLYPNKMMGLVSIITLKPSPKPESTLRAKINFDPVVLL